ncbi:hypothetical protein PFAS1_20020 [Pseudomonas frederiksbergensis]|uniref:glycosyltransferase n=1 Tax=Pseudomonas frederiksbergensis TaxID=104087 RepID=UPI000957E51A|nr:glycosyltransferase [Pseudomonas frederiksbergensis]APV41534.1 hypothetical protein PFAS1_20020 [Pseudomonas frederiksbergensis]
MENKSSGTALREGNAALREKKYSIALEKYKQALIELPELTSAIEFNISLTQQYLGEALEINSIESHSATSPPAVFTSSSPKQKTQTEPEKRQKRVMRGYFDRLDETGLSGWAINEKEPNTPVELSIFVDGIHFLDIQSSEPRKDLISKNIQGAKAGFQINWPSGLFNNGTDFDVRFKNNEKSLSKSPKSFPGEAASAATNSTRYLDELRSGLIRYTTVIVPIYNAYDAVSECISSLIDHTSIDVKILLIDDCSTDSRIGALLSKYEHNDQFVIIRNASNLGYTCTINKAIKACQADDVVLLNSDTVVTNRWLDNLRYAAYSQALVATVTAMSDNAGAFSAPEIGVFNPIPPHLDTSSYARIITNSADGRSLQVPTGNGFCMFIRRAAMETLGLFDEKKFPRGYGEENDFCMRALRQGWKNLVCNKAYVYHKRSQSFQGEKVKLMASGAAQLGLDYPDYKHLTKRFRDVEFTYVRHKARTGIATKNRDNARPRILYVISTQTGGTPQTNLDLMRSMVGRYECFLLRCDSKVITLSQLIGNVLFVQETHTLTKPIEPTTHVSEEYDRVALDILYRYSIDMVHIRHIAWHGMGLAEAAKSINLPVIYSSHDFYAVCPSLNLLDESLKYCGGSCTKGSGTCQIGLWEPHQLPPLKDAFIHRWREMFSKFFSYCDVIISTAPSAREIFLNSFPETTEKFVVIPHGRDFEGFEQPSDLVQPGKIKVLVPGNISRSKGAHLIKEISELDEEGLLEFNFLGNVAGILSKVGVHHGQYERAEFKDKVKQIAPTVGMVLSIWPETYCHTLTEMWACGIPVFGIDVGAVGDRIRESNAGWLISPNSTAREIYDEIIKEVTNRSGFTQRAIALRKWQATEGVWNNTSTMAAEYRLIYQNLLHETATMGARIGLLIKGKQTHPATAYIRVLQPLRELENCLNKVDIRQVDTAWILAGGAEKLDALIIQRDAIPAKHADGVITKLKEAHIPYIYEIDDMLWNLPVSHGDHSIDTAQKKAIKKLAGNAALVTTSTETLSENLKQFNSNILVIPNSHNRSLWQEPIALAYLNRVHEENGLGGKRQRILYMGTKSHATDLAIIIPAIEEIVRRNPDTEIIQIGGGVALPYARELVVPVEIRTYPEFVLWFRSVCCQVTIALAPLEDTLFNSAKSDIKALDYGFAGVPAVYSNVGPYALSIENNRTGLLAENSIENWIHAIEKLLSDEALQMTIREEALAECMRRAEINIITRPWLAAFDLVVSSQLERSYADKSRLVSPASTTFKAGADPCQ